MIYNASSNIKDISKSEQWLKCVQKIKCNSVCKIARYTTYS